MIPVLIRFHDHLSYPGAVLHLEVQALLGFGQEALEIIECAHHVGDSNSVVPGVLTLDTGNCPSFDDDGGGSTTPLHPAGFQRIL